MYRYFLAGVMVIGLGLTSTLAAQPDEEPNPSGVKSVVFKKKDKTTLLAEDDLVIKNKPKEVFDSNDALRELNEEQIKERQRKQLQRQRELQELARKQAERERKERLERERIERLERERLERIEKERLERERLARAEQQERQRKLDEARKNQPVKEPTQQVAATSSSNVQGTLTMSFTNYVALCDTGCTGITATGVDVRGSIYYQGMRVIAVDPSVIPLHSIVQFELNGQKVKAIAIDTGGAIKGHKIDLLVSSVSEARAFGRVTKTVEVLRYGK